MLETFAHRRQDDDRHHAPEDAEHREKAAELVRAEVLQRLEEGFAHGSTQPGVTWQDELVAGLQAVEHFDLRAVADADFDRHSSRPVFAPGATTSTKAAFFAS